ncbi:MAG: cobalamin-dependent protein [Candidatus Omnitrophota bacterium]|nr:MAG: cobalamin-dependent protein [Candidatus Omnitrophota bacterium]
MKAVLVNIYPRETVARNLLSCYVLKAYLDKYWEVNNLDVEVLNFSEKIQIEELSKKLIERKADLIGYSGYIWNIEKILGVIKIIKGKKEGIIHVLGGPEISTQRILSMPRSLSADFYIVGEGEKKLLNLINYIHSRKKGSNIELPRGVAYWEKDNLKYCEEGCADNIEDLDEIPSVYISKTIDDNLYERQQVFLETQRGCKYKCKYCVYHKFLSSIKYYSKERVMQELDRLIIDKQVAALRITDAIFTSDLERTKEIVKHLLELKQKGGVRLPWIYWEFDYNSVDEEFIRLTASLKYREKILNTNELLPLDRAQLYSDMLKDYTVINSIGIESFCERALRAVGRRRIDLKKFDIFMKTVNAYNIVVKMDLILGLPFETLESYFEGLELILPYFRNTDHVLNIHLLQVLPGSELEELSGEYKIKYSQRAPHTVFSTNSLTEEDINLALKLSAVLSRVVNSPLRSLFFEAWKSSGKNLTAMIERIYGEICASQKFDTTPLVQTKILYDSYWNDLIYQDIPSEFIDNLLKSYC